MAAMAEMGAADGEGEDDDPVREVAQPQSYVEYLFRSPADAGSDAGNRRAQAKRWASRWN